MEEMMAKIAAEASSNYRQDTRVTGRVVESDGVMLTVIGNDGYRYTVEEASNGKDSILVMHDSGRTAVKGVVTDMEVGL